MFVKAFSLPSPDPSGLVRISNGHWKLVQRGEGDLSPAPLVAALMGFEVSQILMVANEIGIFSALSQGKLCSSALCDAVQVPYDSGIRFLRACVALEFLEEKGGLFANTAVVQAYLNPESPSFIGGLLQYYQTDVYTSYAHLKEAVLQNAPQVHSETGPTDIFSATTQAGSPVSHFTQAMQALSRMEGQTLARLFPFGEIRRLLDVGGGSGTLAHTLAKSYPQLVVHVFDRPAVCTLGRQSHTSIDFIEGDFWKDPLPCGYDAILLSMVLHDWGLEEGSRLVRKCYAALPRGGVLLVFEQLLDDSQYTPLATVLSDVTMLLRTRTGREYSETQYRQLLLSIGFSDVQVARGPGLRQLMWAVKP